MINTSFEFRRIVANGVTPRIKATLIFENGDTEYLIGSDFMQNSMFFT